MVSTDQGTSDGGAPQAGGTAPSVASVRGPSWELGEGSLTLGTGVRLLLWDYGRGSLAYDLALALIALVLLLVPGSFWGDPLWRP